MNVRDHGSAILCRSLAALGRSGASGAVEVAGDGGKTARIDVEEGRIASIAMSDGSAMFGDLLVREGGFAPVRFVDEAGRDEGEPIGRFLLREGRIDAPTLSRVLRLQTRERLRTLFTWPLAKVHFARRPRVLRNDELPTMVDVIVDALRTTAPDLPVTMLARFLGREPLVLSSFGRELLRGAPLRPEESVVVVLAERGIEAHTLLGFDRRALRFAVALRRIGAIEPPRASGRYSLLLRKHHELRRSSEATTLLGVPKNASPSEARRALRSLARELHPDRFDGSSDRAARNVSAEVLKALVAAESELARDANAFRAK